MHGERSDVLDLCSGNGSRSVPHDGEDGSFDRHLQRLRNTLDTGLQCPTQIACVDSIPTLDAAGETQEKVRQDHSAVASGPQHGGLGSILCHNTDGSLRAFPQTIRDRLNCQEQIGPGVTIGNGKHVDAIELATLLLCPLATCRKSPSEPRSVYIADLHCGKLMVTNPPCRVLP
jgi:hypothetical protein